MPVFRPHFRAGLHVVSYILKYLRACDTDPLHAHLTQCFKKLKAFQNGNIDPVFKQGLALVGEAGS